MPLQIKSRLHSGRNFLGSGQKRLAKDILSCLVLFASKDEQSRIKTLSLLMCCLIYEENYFPFLGGQSEVNEKVITTIT
jgi:hypothetical protein